MDGDDVIVADGGRGAGLAQEAFAGGGAGGQLRGHHLDGDDPVQDLVEGPQYHTHPAPADEVEHLVVAEPAQRVGTLRGAQEVEGIAVLVVRLLEDYVVIPRVMGHVTGISPLLVLVGVTAIGLLFGGFYVLLATPLLAVLVTLVDVVVRDRDPAEEDVPAVLFAKESTGS